MHKLLIVDGSATMRKIIQRVLGQAEIHAETVLEASNGLEALEQLTLHPDVNLVLSDVNMPEMDGLDLLRTVRQAGENDRLPIIMVTTEAGDSMRERALRGGADGYVCMPFTPETFSQALEPYVD